MPARLLLLCLLFRSSWLTVEDGRQVGAARLLHRRGGRGSPRRCGCWFLCDSLGRPEIVGRRLPLHTGAALNRRASPDAWSSFPTISADARRELLCNLVKRRSGPWSATAWLRGRCRLPHRSRSEQDRQLGVSARAAAGRGAGRLAPARSLPDRPTRACVRPWGNKLVGVQRRTPAPLAAIDQLVVYYAVIRVADDQLARSSVRRASICHTARLLQALAGHPFARVRQRDLPRPTHADVHTDCGQIHRHTSWCVAPSRRGAGLPPCRLLPS